MLSVRPHTCDCVRVACPKYLMHSEGHSNHLAILTRVWTESGHFCEVLPAHLHSHRLRSYLLCAPSA